MGSRMPRMGIRTGHPDTRHRRATSLADALFTTTQQRVLRLLFGNPDRTWIKQELIEQTGSGSGAVQRELARLIESGLVSQSRIGSQKHYQPNREAPIFDELRGIVTKTVGLVDPLRAALRPLARRIDRALVFGSVARGQARARSDVDLLVVAEGLTLEELFSRLAPAEKALGRKVHPTLYTPEEFARRRKSGNPFLRKVLSGEHIVLIGPNDGLDKSR